MIIRPLTAQDIPALADIADAALFPGEMLADMCAPALDGTAPDRWLVAAAQDTPVGFCFAVPEPMTEGAWNMRALAVAPDHHRTGTGAALVAALEAQLAKGGARLLVVDTASDADQAPARAFYQACGYAGPNRIPSFWGQGSDKLTYWKNFSEIPPNV